MTHLFGGHWTQEKLRILKKYLIEYAKILKEQSHIEKYAYIDAFAGTGYIREDNSNGLAETVSLFPETPSEAEEFLNGSARTALEADAEFDSYIFIEKDEEYYGKLQDLEKEYPSEEIIFSNQDANDWLVDRCRNYDWSKHRALVFLDPFGMQVQWSTIEAISDTEAIDLWVLFPIGVAANRLLKREGEIPSGWKRRLNLVFGTDNWEQEFYDRYETLFGGTTPKKTVDLFDIGEFYHDRMRNTFARVAEDPYVLEGPNGTPLYLFYFAAANPNAADTAVRIAQYIIDA